MLPWSIRPSTFQLSLTYCGSFLLFGLVTGGIGPIIPVKAAEMNVKETDLGVAFMMKGLGGLLGSYVAPMLEQYMRLNKLLSVCCAVLGLCSAVLADTGSLMVFASTMFIAGMMIMFINILATVALIRIMNKISTEAWIKALHMTFGIGAFLSPLCITLLGPSAFKVYPVVALLLCLLFVFFDHPASERTSALDLETGDEERVIVENRPIPPAFDTAIAAFLFLYAGVEVIYWGWINTFGILSDGISVEQSLYGSSIFWVCMTIGRGLTIPLAYVLSTSRQLMLLLAGVFLSVLTCIYFAATKQDIYVLFAGSSLMGFFCSSMYPLTMNLPNSLGMKTTTKNTSKYALGGSLGESVLPFVGGLSISWFGKNAMFGCELVLLVVIVLTYRYALKVAEVSSSPASAIEMSLAKGDLYRKLND